MNRSTIRSLVSETAIGVAVASGVYLVGADSLARAAAEVRARHDARYAQSVMSSDPGTLREVAFIRQRLQHIESQSKFAADELETLSALGRIAEQSGVRIETLEQLTPAPLAAQPDAGEAASGTPQTIRERRIGFSLVGVGTYSQAASLIGAIQTQLGYARIESMRLVPSGDTNEPLVKINLTTHHWWFDASGGIAALDSIEPRAEAPR